MGRTTRTAAVVLLLILTGCMGSGPRTTAERMAAAKHDVMDTAEDVPGLRLGQWVRLCQQAGVVDMLSSAGPYTVFAPTDEAFAALPPPVQEDLLDVNHAAKLRAVLLRHVHGGDAVASADVGTGGGRLSSADGSDKPLTLSAANGSLTVNGAKVIRSDVYCRNGVIHTVDRVLTP